MSLITNPTTLNLDPSAPFVVKSGMNFVAPGRLLGNGNWAIDGLRIFKSGTFKDSMGFQRTWEVEHLEQMIFNYNMLRDRGLFPNVPVRTDHSASIDRVVGYIESLRRDGNFLVADLEITEPDAYDKWKRGTFRSRSLEVGAYETNDESMYWPVVMGLAFVDIPAVEGLHSKNKESDKLAMSFSQYMQDEHKETSVAEDATNQDKTDGGEQQTDGGEKQTQTTPPTAPAQTETQPAPPAPVTPGEPQIQEGDNQGEGQHRAGSFSFRVNGQTITDFGAVQRHIEALEGFQRESIKTARQDFVKGLATDNKIAATQLDSLTELAVGMSDEQFNAFKVSYESAPQSSLLASHGNTGGGTPPAGSPADEERQILEEQVAMHRRSGMSEDKLQKTDSYRRLQELKTSGTAA